MGLPIWNLELEDVLERLGRHWAIVCASEKEMTYATPSGRIMKLSIDEGKAYKLEEIRELTCKIGEGIKF